MTDAIIKVNNLNLDFGPRKVLDNINIQFEQGETVLIAGGNGAGKSSFLKCLAGVLLPKSGEIQFSKAVTAEKIAFLSDKMSFFQDFTLEQGIEFHCRAFGVDTFDDVLLQELKLPRDRKVRELSNGERALFQLSLLMSQKPGVLLVDEILHIIDPYLREMFLYGLIDMIDEYKTTVITINHTFSDIGLLPERLLIMENGRFVLDEKSEDLPNRFKKFYSTDRVDRDLPIIFGNESPLAGEWFVYPYQEKMAGETGYEFLDVELGEVVKSFIGGYYAKKRI